MKEFGIILGLAFFFCGVCQTRANVWDAHAQQSSPNSASAPVSGNIWDQHIQKSNVVAQGVMAPGDGAHLNPTHPGGNLFDHNLFNNKNTDPRINHDGMRRFLDRISRYPTHGMCEINGVAPAIYDVYGLNIGPNAVGGITTETRLQQAGFQNMGSLPLNQLQPYDVILTGGHIEMFAQLPEWGGQYSFVSDGIQGHFSDAYTNGNPYTIFRFNPPSGWRWGMQYGYNRT